MDELKEKMKGFDWFYMFSDDHNVWRKWSNRKKEIVTWAKSQGFTNEQILEAVKSVCSYCDHYIVSDWTYKD